MSAENLQVHLPGRVLLHLQSEMEELRVLVV